MTVPVIRLVRKHSPGIKISILTKPIYQKIFREIEDINLIKLEDKGQHKGLIGLMRLNRQLKKTGIDAVIDLHKVLRTNFLKIIWGKNFYQIDNGRKAKENLINGSVFKQLKTSHQRYLDVFKNINFNLSLSNI